MRFSRLFSPKGFILTTIIPFVVAQFPVYTEVSSANLDLSSLGRVSLTGNFDAISIYEWIGQNEIPPATNGSQSLLAQLPNGAFQTLVTADGSITTMCPFVRKGGDLFGVIVGGNFTSLGGTPTQGIALFNVTTNGIVPLQGLNGSVNALFCDESTDSVYIGGDFKGAGGITNAIVWVGDTGFERVPFSGFNAPVSSIAQLSNGNIVWGGSFTGLGNMSVMTSSDSNDLQVINLSTANVTAQGTSTLSGFNDPKNIVCKTADQDAAGSTWLVEDDSPGYWQATFNFGFTPSKIRLYNTRYEGRGTKTWRFSNDPTQVNSILRLNYTDPATNQTAQCDQTCPLSNDPNVEYQDFFFINSIGMNSFRIDISDWYGKGAGLDGIEVYQNDILSYAVSSFDEPACSVPTEGSNATTTGPWQLTPSDNSIAQYLTAKLQGPGVNSESASVTFQPDIKQSGNYTIIVYTPGCEQDNDCALRGIANVTGILTAGGSPISAQVYQTNNFDKYDQIYTGFIDASTTNFRPTITLQPLANQNSSIDLVALSVGFQLLDPSSVGLNGLYEFDPFNTTAQTDFKESQIDSIGINLNIGAQVNSLLTVGGYLYVGGAFHGSASSNFMVIDIKNNSVSIPGLGLNGPVNSQANIGNTVYMGGNFTNANSTINVTATGLSHVATFDVTRLLWGSVGNGVDGPVTQVIPLSVNIQPNSPELCIAVNGDFQNVLAFNGSPSFAADGFAIWVPSQNNWIKNLNIQSDAISGQIEATTNLTVDGQLSSLFSGTVSDQGLAAQYAAELSSQGGNATLSGTGLNIQSSSSSPALLKRDNTQNSTAISGIYAGHFDTNNGRNLSIYGGHFTLANSNGANITNLAIINDAQNGTVSGLSNGIDSNSTFTALTVSGDTLYAGGSITGNVQGTQINGFVAWNLATSQYNSTLPPPLGGSNVTVAAISPRPSSSDIYVAGNFDSAGGLGCPGVCVFSNGVWTKPGTAFSGNVTGLLWQGNNELLAVGNLTVSNTQTSIAVYDAQGQTWSIPNGAAVVPGPVTALSPASSDGSSYWIGGQSATNGSAFLMLYSGGNYQIAPQLGSGSIIKGLSVFSLTSGHGSNSFLDSSLALLVTGSLNVQPLGSAAGALFNGTGYTPFILTYSGSGPGSLGTIVTEQNQSFNTSGSHLALGFVILISLAIALGLIFILILIGYLIERRRRAAEGYRPAPQNYFEKTANMGRIPPERLFGDLNNTTMPRV